MQWQTPNSPTYANLKTPEVKDEDKKRKQKAGPAFEAGEVADDFYKDGMVAELAIKTLRNIGRKSEPFFTSVAPAVV